MPSNASNQLLAAVLVVLSVLVLSYSLIIAQALLLGGLVVVAIWLFYLFYRVIETLDRIATTLERREDRNS